MHAVLAAALLTATSAKIKRVEVRAVGITPQIGGPLATPARPSDKKPKGLRRDARGTIACTPRTRRAVLLKKLSESVRGRSLARKPHPKLSPARSR